MKNMRILYLVGGTDDRYGAPKLAESIILSLKNRYDVEFCVITAKMGMLNQFCDCNKVENFNACFKYSTFVPIGNPLLNFMKHRIKQCVIAVNDWKAIKQIEKKVDLKSFDLIHTNMNRDLIGGILSEKYKIPHIWHLQEMYEAHFGLAPIYANQLKWMNRHSDHYIAISRTVAEDWIRNGLDQSKTSVIYNGIAIEQYSYECKEKRDFSICRIIMAGLIYKEKGQENLIRALSLLSGDIRKRIRLDLYGEAKPEYHMYLQQMIIDMRLENVVSFKGYCPNLAGIINQYDVGINCSKAEGFGLSTVEFMASGVCPIVANTGANLELVIDGSNGLVFQYGDINDLSDKILKVVNDPTLLNMLKENARLDAETRFSIDRMSEEIMEIYKNVVKQRN